MHTAGRIYTGRGQYDDTMHCVGGIAVDAGKLPQLPTRQRMTAAVLLRAVMSAGLLRSLFRSVPPASTCASFLLTVLGTVMLGLIAVFFVRALNRFRGVCIGGRCMRMRFCML